MNPLKYNIIFSAHISPAPLLIIWLNMCLSRFRVYWSDQDEFIFLVVNRRSCAVTCFRGMGQKNRTLTAMWDQYSPCINSRSAFDLIYRSVNDNFSKLALALKHKIRNYMVFPAISSMAGVSASSWSARLETHFSIQGKTSGKLNPLSQHSHAEEKALLPDAAFLMEQWWRRRRQLPSLELQVGKMGKLCIDK